MSDNNMKLDRKLIQKLQKGVVIPAHPLALNVKRKLDERRQRALSRYYIAAGAGGLAVGVHTTQFEIRDPKIGLFKPVLQLAIEEINRAQDQGADPLIRIGGICGDTKQATTEAALLCDLGYHLGLLSLAAMRDADDDELIQHCKAVADIIPLFGFYLQPAVGGRPLSYNFWRRFAEIKNVLAIKIAPFNRYQTMDVVRAITDAERNDIALYTGNDDNIVMDLLTPYRFKVDRRWIERRIVGGLLGHWAVWTLKAVELLNSCNQIIEQKDAIPPDMLVRSNQITDANAAFFDAANKFAGCIAGIHDVLRRQGLLEGIWCLNPNESLGPGQSAEIERVYRAYPHLNDDEFVAENRNHWMAG
ncbi:MAG: dihydrodipicolinate synthase family protein [Planctomycetota bacterium]|nr:MAG: dihydrodipicolinate synthase family protein [Planctomycetota bacterium]